MNVAAAEYAWSTKAEVRGVQKRKLSGWSTRYFRVAIHTVEQMGTDLLYGDALGMLVVDGFELNLTEESLCQLFSYTDEIVGRSKHEPSGEKTVRAAMTAMCEYSLLLQGSKLQVTARAAKRR